MADGVRHLFRNAIADQADATATRPSDWNRKHYVLNDDDTPAGALGDLLCRGVDGLITRLDGAAGVLASAGSGQLPSYRALIASDLPSGLANVVISGPTVARTYTFPDANATILTTNAAVTAAQGGTGLSSYAVGDLLVANTTSSLSKLAAVAVGQVLASNGVGAAPVYTSSPSLTDLTLSGALGIGSGTIIWDGVSALQVNKEIRIAGAGDPTAVFGANNTNASYRALATDVVGDTYNRFTMTISGEQRWGLGVTDLDTLFYRSAEAALTLHSINSVDAILGVASAAGTTRGFDMRTGSETRWKVFANSVAESGANAGSDFNIARYDDDGVYIGTALAISRATGVLSASGAIVAGGNLLFGGAYNIGDGAGNSPFNGWFENQLTIGGALILDVAGGVPAQDAGAIRTENGQGWFSRNAAQTADNFVIGYGTAFADTVSIGQAGVPVSIPGGLGLGTTPPANGMLALTEQTAPSAPAANGAIVFAQDNGAGKTQLMVLFATGAAQQIAIQP
jgi:hypothetical protein